MRRKSLTMDLLLAGAVPFVFVLGLALLPIPRTISVDTNGATGRFGVANGYVWNTTCTTLRWELEGIAAVRVGGEGAVGAGEREVCTDVPGASEVAIDFTDGTSTVYPAPVVRLSRSTWTWGAFAVGLLLWGGALAAQLAPDGWRPTRETWRRVRGGLVSAGIGLLLTAVLLEIVFRVYIGAFGSERDRLIYIGSAEAIAEANSVSIGMPFVGFGGIPGERGVNARGFRGDPVPHPKPDDTYRILALGGSTTYGDGVTAEEAYPPQLQSILRDDYGYTDVDVVNGGFPSYTSMNSLVNFITRGVEVDPDLVIVYHANNDLVKRWDHPDCFAGDNPLYGFGGDPGYWDNDAQPLSPSVAVRYVQINFGLIPDPSSFDWQLGFSELCDRSEPVPNFMDRIERNDASFFERNLAHFAYIAEGHGIDLLLVTQVYDTDQIETLAATNDPQDQWASVMIGMTEHNDIVRELASQDGVRVYDFAAEWEPNPDLWLDYIHLNADGLRLQAEMIAAYLDREGVIPSSD